MRARVLGLLPCLAACARGAPARLPHEPPATLARIAEQPGPDGARARGIAGLPPARAPLRRDACGVPLAVSPEGLMRPGGIWRLQQRLVEISALSAGSFRAGELDAPTLAAIRDFQDRAGLPPVGLPSYAAVEALGLELDGVYLAGDPTCRAGGAVGGAR